MVEIRFGEFEICRPRLKHDRSLAKTVRLRLVEVREANPPEGVEPLHWRLLTSHTVADVAQAWRIVDWYQMRWIVEQLFRVRKSQGLGLEESQVASAERLMKLAAAAIRAACTDIQLVRERDGIHGLSSSAAFAEDEIDTIEALSPTLDGKTARQQNPHPLRSLARASWVMARLGRERFQAIHEGRIIEIITKLYVEIPWWSSPRDRHSHPP